MSGKSLVLSGPTDVPTYEGKTVDFVFNRLKDQPGERVLMVEHSTKTEFTVHDFLSKSIKLAEALRKLGMKEGDVISLITENRLNAFIPILAALYLGLTVNPLNPVYAIGEIKHAFGLTRPKLVFCSASVLPKIIQLQQETDHIEKIISLEDVKGGIMNLDAIIDEIQINVNDFEVNRNFSDENVAFILSSSGTTGLPKGVMLTYDSLRYHSLYVEWVPYVNMTSKDVTVGVVPFFHIFGLFVHLFALLIGMKSVLVQKFKPEIFLEIIQEYKVTKLFSVPQLVQFLAYSPLFEKYDLSSVNDVLCGSAPLSSETAEKLEARLGIKLRQMYGLTETGVINCVPLEGSKKLGTTGILVPTIIAKIRDVETKKLLGPNEHGEICVKGPTLMKGYVGNPQATLEAYDEEGYICTGDIGYYDEDGYFYIIDRIKDLIKYKGFQVPTVELETILIQHPAVAEVSVVGIPDARAGEVPLAVVVKRPGHEVTEEELINLVASQVSVLKHLHGGVKFVDSLPKTPSGKIVKKDLRNMFKPS